jgi:protein-S-isoprenylcysteine O-methyltransferase Ste14
VSTAELLARTAALYAPMALVAVAVADARRTGRRVDPAAAVITTGWTAATVFVVNVVAQAAGWWRFADSPAALAGVPLDLWLGWTLLWGLLPVVAGLDRRAAIAAGLVAVDLVAMPRLGPVLDLGPRWLVGEAVAVAVVLLPGLALAGWTATRTRLTGRLSLQVVGFATFLFFVVPTTGMQLTGGSWAALLDQPRWLLALAAAVIAPTQAMSLQAARELARRGGGTPVPLDPPVRLVTTGPYAYLANPLQVSATVGLLTLSLLVGSIGVALAAVVAAVFSVGVAKGIEDDELADRFGDDWRHWRATVRLWRPRLRPTPAMAATVYVAETCEPCREVGTFLAARHPQGLRITAAEDHPGDLTRVTYEAPGERSTGIEALARSLEHAHLGWAAVAWIARAPVIVQLLQLVADAVGGGPRSLPAAPVCPTGRSGRSP